MSVSLLYMFERTYDRITLHVEIKEKRFGSELFQGGTAGLYITVVMCYSYPQALGPVPITWGWSGF